MVVECEVVGPGWIMHDLSEIKPGNFTAFRSMEKEYDSRVEDIKQKATTDPMYKYYKRFLPKQREAAFQRSYKRPELEENYRNPRPRGLDYETSDKGHSLMQNYLKDLPKDKVTALSTDVAGLKKELREVAMKETEEVRSKIKPNSAHKVYAWRGLLEEKESKSNSYSCIQVPSEVYLPDKTGQMISVYHRQHREDGKVRKVNGVWQVPHLGPSITRDRYGLRILDNLELESETLDTRRRAGKTAEYHYSWPLTDSNTGDSVKDWVKQ